MPVEVSKARKRRSGISGVVKLAKVGGAAAVGGATGGVLGGVSAGAAAAIGETDTPIGEAVSGARDIKHSIEKAQTESDVKELKPKPMNIRARSKMRNVAAMERRMWRNA